MRQCDLCGRATDNHGPIPDRVICDRAACAPEREHLLWQIHVHEDWRHWFSFQGETPEHTDDEEAAALEAEHRLGVES